MAVCPPAEVLDAVEELVGLAREAHAGPRWSARAAWHLTLLFLGPVESLAAVTAALDGLSARPSLRFRLGGGGAFPNQRRGRVLWLGPAEGGEALAALAGAVGAALRPLGYQTDHAVFRPHLTVARLKAPADVHAAVAALGPGPVGPAWTVDELVLFQSHLAAGGPRYKPLARVGLSGVEGG